MAFSLFFFNHRWHKIHLQRDYFLVVNSSMDFYLSGPHAACHRTSLPSQSFFIRCVIEFCFVLSLFPLLLLFLIFLNKKLEIKNCVSRSIPNTIFVICCHSSGLSAECFQSKFNFIKKASQLDFRLGFDLLTIYYDPGTCTYIISFCQKNL